MTNREKLYKLSQLIRYYILTATSRAGSGHPSSSLSATELMTALMFGDIFRFDADNPDYHNNDRLIFSKGHAAPLLYALWLAAGKVSESEMMTLRRFGSPLEGHPTFFFPYTEAATGSLGQGLSIGVGMALNAKHIDKLPYRTYVLLGDSEIAEGSVWEAVQVAAYYHLDNLVGVLDVNRLGQRGETMYGHDVQAYQQRIKAFGWQTFLIEDGHSFPAILAAYKQASRTKGKPVMIIAKTMKGKGVSFMEDKDGWHGKALKEQELEMALNELGKVDLELRGEILKPEVITPKPPQEPKPAATPSYPPDQPLATRKAYGRALVRLFPQFPNIVVLDAETSNSTFAETFKKAHPERFFEMFIAEQNMVGVALGLARRGKVPFVSSFAAFLTRAFDQIRMSPHSRANIKLVGSHCGVSIGADGASQMGLEDLSMFRAVLGSVVLYPADAMACEKLVEEAIRHKGIVYLRTTRKDTPLIYQNDMSFRIGGSHVLKSNVQDMVTVVAAGITLHEALEAYEELARENIFIRVIDCYSIKPIDKETLLKANAETKAIITVEDHFAEGGVGEAVAGVLTEAVSSDTRIKPVVKLAVRKVPRSGTPEELLDYEKISKNAIVEKVKEFLNRN